MTNPTTIDRRDVANPTNPVSGNTAIENHDLGQPLDADADPLPAAGQGSSISGVPGGGNPNDATSDTYGGLQRGIPPARSGKASAEKDVAEVRGRTSNSGGTERIDPDTRIPEPVTQDPGFSRSFEK
ncbi:MAG: hypothetical protein JWM58_4581 [Rhizobium sp.]|nr:hypothetical protein [Rhizobium sp.]